jgi:hypothetical protein
VIASALALTSQADAFRARAGSLVAQPAGTIVVGPTTLATTSTTTLQNHPTCGSQGCTYIQWSGSAADSTYASSVNGTIVAWRVASGSAGNKVKLRVLRPAGGGKFSAVSSSATETTSGNASAPDQFAANIPVKAGDMIALDNANSALIFKTGVLGVFPEFWTPPLPDGGSPSPPTAPTGTTTNGYQLQIDAYVQPAPNPTTTTTTTGATTTTVTTTTTTTTTTPTTTTSSAGHTSLAVTGVQLKASWKRSRLTGKVRFSVTVRGPSRLTASIRGAGGGPVRAERHYSTGRAGTFSETLRLSPRTPPGAFSLRVLATTGSASQAVRETRLVLKAPAEGIVDFASIGLVKGGRGASAFGSPQKTLWVRFRFLAKPSVGRTVRIVWRTPSFKLVGAVSKPVTTTLDSSLRSAVPLARGRWYAILSVNGTVVKRIGVRIT